MNLTHSQNYVNDGMFYIAFGHVRNTGQPHSRVMDGESKAFWKELHHIKSEVMTGTSWPDAWLILSRKWT